MLLHHDPTAPRNIITYLCPQTLQCAAVDLDADTIHPAPLDGFADCTTEFINSIIAHITPIRNKPFKPTLITKSIVKFPEWILFSTITDEPKLLIAHTTKPIFLSPLKADLTAIQPIADSPPLTEQHLAHWLPLATQAAKNLARPTLEKESNRQAT